MRKTVYLLLLFIFVAILGYKLWSLNSKGYIETANQHMDMNGLKLMMTEKDMSETIKSDFLFYPGMFGGNRYKSESKGLIIAFSGFPDTLDKPVLMEITTTNPTHQFYQIHVGDNVQGLEQILRNNGFEAADSNSNGRLTFRKKALSVSMDLTEETIKEMTIRLYSTNKKGIVY